MELGRLIRKVFVPEDGCVFLDADYSQIELRVLAHMSGDETLIQAYQQAQDIHRLTASQVFHVPLDEVTPAAAKKCQGSELWYCLRHQLLWTEPGLKYYQKRSSSLYSEIF